MDAPLLPVTLKLPQTDAVVVVVVELVLLVLDVDDVVVVALPDSVTLPGVRITDSRRIRESPICGVLW